MNVALLWSEAPQTLPGGSYEDPIPPRRPSRRDNNRSRAKETCHQSYGQILCEHCRPHCPRPTYGSHRGDAGRHIQWANCCDVPWNNTEISMQENLGASIGYHGCRRNSRLSAPRSLDNALNAAVPTGPEVGPEETGSTPFSASGAAIQDLLDISTVRFSIEPATCVWKLDSERPDSTHAELTQGKTDESEEPSS